MCRTFDILRKQYKGVLVIVPVNRLAGPHYGAVKPTHMDSIASFDLNEIQTAIFNLERRLLSSPLSHDDLSHRISFCNIA